MNKKLIIGFIIIAIFLIGLGLIVRYNIGDLRPALLPTGITNQRQPSLFTTPSTETTSVTPHPTLKAPDGFVISTFSDETPSARDLQFSPDGTLLASLKTAGKVVALPDQNQDGVADRVIDVLTQLRGPHGLAFQNGKLFVAEERQLARYTWNEQTLTAQFEKKLFDFPGGGAGHTSRSLVFGNDGKLYISLGSTCNVCIQENPWHAAVIVTDEDGRNPQLFARGLRNAVFLTKHPTSGTIWVTEMGRDLLGDDIPADEINILQANADYGWPYCYGRKVYDRNFNRESPAYCEKTIAPTFELQAHSAPLGLTFIPETWPAEYRGDLLVGFHGSWNRSVPTGYKVVRLHVEGERITGQTDLVTGFLQGSNAIGRPVDVEFDSQGNLYISDDKAGTVYRVTSP